MVKWSLITFISDNGLLAYGIPTLGLVLGAELAFLGLYVLGLTLMVNRLRHGLAYALVWAARASTRRELGAFADAELIKTLKLWQLALCAGFIVAGVVSFATFHLCSLALASLAT